MSKCPNTRALRETYVFHDADTEMRKEYRQYKNAWAVFKTWLRSGHRVALFYYDADGYPARLYATDGYPFSHDHR